MAYLIAGLVLFLGVHSVRMVAPAWREKVIARFGQTSYKGLYSLASLLGFSLIVWGFGQARENPVMLWVAPQGMRHAMGLLMVLAFVLLAASYVPRNSIKGRWHHPMVLAVKTWALAHLLANGSVAHVLLFGSFLAWGVANFVMSRKRDRQQGTVYPAGTFAGNAGVVVLGLAAWALFAFWLHGLLIGFRPFG